MSQVPSLKCNGMLLGCQPVDKQLQRVESERLCNPTLPKSEVDKLHLASWSQEKGRHP